MRVLLVAPPRLLWPYINEQDNYLLPQPLVYLGGALREAGVEVRVIDCMPERMGWRTLARRIQDFDPQVVAAGENHALFASEIIRLVRLTRAVAPRAFTIVGGAHFTNTVSRYLPDEPIDFIVRGEGERTLVELVEALEDSGVEGGRGVDGVAYVQDGEVRHSAPRALIPDLDDLPAPAFGLLPMDRYGTARYLFSPGGTTIHHSRGCSGSCRFCAWWRQMAERRVEAGPDDCPREHLKPRWRTKSVARTVEEMSTLYHRYHKRCLVFVDPTFNVDPRWSDAFAEAVLARDWDLNWFGFMRADYVLRDEQLGVMEKLVRSGLRHVCIGVERPDPVQLKAWNKHGADADVYRETFALFKERYPEVFLQATFIVGTRDETPASIEGMVRFAQELGVDHPAFHPVTPFPGTDLYEEALERGWLELTDFDHFDLMTATMPSEHMSREEIDAALADINGRMVTPRWLLEGLRSPHRYRRDMYRWFLMVSARLFADAVLRAANPFSAEAYTSPYAPPWYEK
jgi:anaerobic magnesium-protoporphyrin IX monomethyl ester cyclase